MKQKFKLNIKPKTVIINNLFFYFYHKCTMDTVLLISCENLATNLFILKNLINIEKNFFLFLKFNFKIVKNKSIYLVIYPRNKKMSFSVRNYLKLSKTCSSKIKINILEKIKILKKNVNTSFHYSFKKSCNLIIKKNLFNGIKKRGLIGNFNVLLYFFSIKNLEKDLNILFRTLLHIDYFFQSINNEIILSGKLKFNPEKKNWMGTKIYEKFPKKSENKILSILCKEQAKTKVTGKLFTLVFYDNYYYTDFINSAEIIGKFFFFKKKEMQSEMELKVCILNSKEINKIIISNAFMAPELEI